VRDARAFARFVAVGVVVTAWSYAVYLALLPFAHYQAAYATGFVAGMVLQVFLHARYVFGVKPTLKLFAGYPVLQGIQYAVGAAVLHVAIEVVRLPRALGLLAVYAVNVPLGFLLARGWSRRAGARAG
jgi:putative flippase GtrA